MIFLISCHTTQTISNKLNYIDIESVSGKSTDNLIYIKEVEKFIMDFESFRSKPYKCLGGMLTVGYGTRASNSNDIIDKQEAQYRLRKYLNNITYKKIKRSKLKITSLEQLIAISSFDFNTNKLKSIINEDNTINCHKILEYNKVRVNNTYKYSEGLNNRRQKEYELCVIK